MNTSLFHDRRANGLLNRVREDVSHLRDDIGQLLNHTTRKTLPNGARELADQARSSARDFADHAKTHLSAGGAYAANRLRDLRSHPPTTRQSAEVLGGLLVVGLIAYGVYALCRNSQAIRDEAARLEDELT